MVSIPSHFPASARIGLIIKKKNMKKCPQCNQEIPESNFQEIKGKTLEWGKVSEKEMTWNEAKKWCEEQGKGWRMPTRVELIQAYDEKVEGFSGYTFWSSTETYSNATGAWVVYLYYGFTNNLNKVNSKYVRCVRP